MQWYHSSNLRSKVWGGLVESDIQKAKWVRKEVEAEIGKARRDNPMRVSMVEEAVAYQVKNMTRQEYQSLTSQKEDNDVRSCHGACHGGGCRWWQLLEFEAGKHGCLGCCQRNCKWVADDIRSNWQIAKRGEAKQQKTTATMTVRVALWSGDGCSPGKKKRTVKVGRKIFDGQKTIESW